MNIVDVARHFGKDAEIGIESVFYGMRCEISLNLSLPRNEWTLWVKFEDGRYARFNLHNGENFRFMSPRTKMLAFHKISRTMLLDLVKQKELRDAGKARISKEL